MKDRFLTSKVATKFLVLMFSLTFSNLILALDYQPKWPEDHLTIGAGFGLNSMPYEGVDPITYPVSYIDARWGGFFIEGRRAGFEFMRHKKVSLSIAGMWDPTELNVSEVNSKVRSLYDGIDNRKPTAQLGIIGYYHSPVGVVEASYFHDVTNRHDSSWTHLKISNPLPETGNFFVNPGFFVRTYAEKYNRYYYSVTREQNIEGAGLSEFDLSETEQQETLERYNEFRPIYKPGNSGHIGFDLQLDYSITQDLIVKSYWSVEILTGEIETSPLVQDKEIYVIEVGLAYQF